MTCEYSGVKRSRAVGLLTVRKKALHISVRGIVQGVGFRPFIYQLSTRHQLVGQVYNTSEGVSILVEGKSESLQAFLKDLPEELPPRAVVEHLLVERCEPSGYSDFVIRESVVEEGKYQLISPDIATCPDCLHEILNFKDRRYRYPFTNCTNCGPRFTIIEDIPYDRSRTTMQYFEMCPDCRREYDDPLNRRFHAQPNACPICGPQLELLDCTGKKLEIKDIISTATTLLKQGNIIAIKSLGGFLLACDATNITVVDRLRKRKNRPAKPFAIMVDTIDTARRYCLINRAEAKLLESPQSPIVLLRRRSKTDVLASVAPGSKYLGVMLPYTPLHHILLRETALPLVMTSGNLSEEPIAKDNEEALGRLSGIPDYFLVHNRLIHSTYDDSVAMVVRGIPQLIRRARGYAPFPIKLRYRIPHVLACGAQEKNTFCLSRDEYAFISQHIGDLENQESFKHFTETVELYEKIFRIKPEIITGDMHPDYLSTRYAIDLAAQRGLKFIPVQHHHAHVVSAMVDAGLTSPVIGVAFDGTGFGIDSHIWGGEFLIADLHSFKRAAHLQYLPLAGGNIAIKKPYRIAVGYLITLFGENILNADLPFLKQVDRIELDIISRQINRHLNSSLTSSCGRLFDAVSALLNVRLEIQYDAQAAIELEMLAQNCRGEGGEYPFCLKENDRTRVINLEGVFQSLLDEIRNKTPVSIISARFHNTVASMIFSLCRAISKDTGIKQTVLTGGVFQNRLLVQKTVKLLKTGRLRVATPRHIPCNDGGISLGQAVIGGKLLSG